MTGAPDWFAQAIAQTPERETLQVGDVPIETLAWGARGDPGLLLLHGNGAHADWWVPFAPFFSSTMRVATLSWSGMGASGRRTSYDFDDHAQELLAVADATGLFESATPPVMVAHSMGAIPALYVVGGEQGARFGRLIVADSGYRPRTEGNPLEGRPAWHNPSYETLEAGAARFRLRPEQECPNPWMVDFIARRSLVRHDDGRWYWRFDAEADRSRGISDPDRLERAIANARCPLDYVWGARSSLCTPENVAQNRALAPAGTRFVEVPDAAHHLMLDQPLAFVAAIRSLLA